MTGTYGAIEENVRSGDTIKSPIRRIRRRSLNGLAIVLALFVPWAVFLTTYGAMSFSVHYEQPAVAYFLVLCALAVALLFGYLAYTHLKRKAAGDTKAEPSWFAFIFVTSLLGWIFGMSGGLFNFRQNMQPFYDSGNLNTYTDIDPSTTPGQQLMDAGHVVFVEGSGLDLSKSMAFRNLQNYCVAPITSGKAAAGLGGLATYDFWAIGMNCCSSKPSDYHCGEFNNPRAQAGLRLLRDDQRAFFRLAVQQAEAAYGIQATHPLFFYWMQDPLSELSSYRDDGTKYFLLGMFIFFALQLFLVVVAVMLFSKLGA